MYLNSLLIFYIDLFFMYFKVSIVSLTLVFVAAKNLIIQIYLLNPFLQRLKIVFCLINNKLLRTYSYELFLSFLPTTINHINLKIVFFEVSKF